MKTKKTLGHDLYHRMNRKNKRRFKKEMQLQFHFNVSSSREINTNFPNWFNWCLRQEYYSYNQLIFSCIDIGMSRQGSYYWLTKEKF